MSWPPSSGPVARTSVNARRDRPLRASPVAVVPAPALLRPGTPGRTFVRMKTYLATNVAVDPRFAERASERFQELDVVALREPFALSGIASLPCGAEGTVVGVWGGGQAYEVEFTEPVAALVTLRPSQVRRAAAA